MRTSTLKKSLLGFLAVLFALAGIQTAHAEIIDYTANKPWYDLSEARVGTGVTDPTTGHETSMNLTAEALIQPIGNNDWYYLLRPRPHIGVNGNLAHKTSFVYTGLTWDLFSYDNFFVDALFGGAVHDGRLTSYFGQPQNRKALGSRFEFHENIEVGYQFCNQYAVSAYIDHLSNAGWLAKTNQGLETAGVHFSYLFH